MAQIYGQPGPEWGDQKVYDVLSTLPDSFTIYAQPKLVYKRRQPRYPDYVIVDSEMGKGVIVVEVKDWVQIEEYNRTSAFVRRRDGSVAEQSSPVEQARNAAHLLENMLKADKSLISFGGKLGFPYTYVGVLPHQPAVVIQHLEQEWGIGHVWGKEDLQPGKILKKLKQVPVPFTCQIFERETRIICALIKPENKRIDAVTGQFKGVIDREQERLAREPLKRPDKKKPPVEQPLPEMFETAPAAAPTIPEEVTNLEADLNVRLVRGFAGTGKTDVLVLRATHLHEQHPDLNILVTTFNDPVYQNRLLPELKHLQPNVDVIKFTSLCTPIYRQKYRWQEPQRTIGVVANLAQDHPLIDEFGRDFLAEEFDWMKETQRTTRKAYTMRIREGRGGPQGQTLNRQAKEKVFDLFELYQAKLQQLGAHDWIDIYEKTAECLAQGIEPAKKYDVILIDEAQHFAPTWVKIIKKFLTPEGTLFLCDDPSQSVYRYYSWRQKGVNVVGRTRWLRVPYRNTRQIFEAAYALIGDDPLAQKLLAEGNESAQPDLSHALLRDGPRPQVHHFSSVQAEREFIAAQIRGLIERQGVRPEEVGLLHEENHVLRRYAAMLPKGVQCYETRRQTGLEYKVVFVPEIQNMLKRTVGVEWGEDQSKQRLKFYMTLTRAREQVYLSYRQQWPKILDPLRPHVEWVQH